MQILWLFHPLNISSVSFSLKVTKAMLVNVNFSTKNSLDKKSLKYYTVVGFHLERMYSFWNRPSCTLKVQTNKSHDIAELYTYRVSYLGRGAHSNWLHCLFLLMFYFSEHIIKFRGADASPDPRYLRPVISDNTNALSFYNLKFNSKSILILI